MPSVPAAIIAASRRMSMKTRFGTLTCLGTKPLAATPHLFAHRHALVGEIDLLPLQQVRPETACLPAEVLERLCRLRLVRWDNLGRVHADQPDLEHGDVVPGDGYRVPVGHPISP